MTQAKDINETIGLSKGQRGIMFAFKLKDGKGASVVFDFYSNGADLNGKRYADAEAAAIRAVVQAGREVESFTHRFI